MNLSPFDRYQEKSVFGSSHWWAINACNSFPPEIAVLDVGPGSGVLGKALRSRNFADVSAVENDPETLERCREFYREIEPTIESFRGKKAFGLVLLLDVLEHMTAPEKFIEQLLPLVTPGGTILISVPNVAHWSMRLSLLFGTFNYTNRGILDRTHYRFFTRKSVRALIRLFPELENKIEAVSTPPFEFLLPPWIWDNGVYRALSRAHYAIAQKLPGFFGYQLLTVVKKRA